VFVEKALSCRHNAVMNHASSRRFVVLMMLLAVFTLTGCGALQSGPSVSVYERVQRASVEVLVAGRLEGSGWFADPQGYVVTAAHIFAGRPEGQSIEIVSPVAGRLPAKIVAVDIGHDLALLHVDGPADARYPWLEVAKRSPQLGEDVFVFGTPMFRHGVVMHGRVARATPSYEYLPGYAEYVYAYTVRGAAPHGSSGGCWVDHRGYVIGNQCGLMIHNNAHTGLAFVIPPQPIARLLAERTDAVTPTLNLAVEELWEQSADYIARFGPGAEGLVPAVVKGVAAEAKLSRDMIITAIDGQPVRYRDELLRTIRQRSPGDTVTLTVAPIDNAEAKKEIQVKVAQRHLAPPK